MAKMKRKATKGRIQAKRAQRKVTVGKLLPDDRREDFMGLGRAFRRLSLQFKSKVTLVPQVGKGGLLSPFTFVLGSQITIHARGEDAEDAVRVLSSLLELGIDANIKRAKREVVIINRLGIHARPSSMFAKVASRFKSEVILEYNGEKVNGKSLMGVHMLCCGLGAAITIHAVGLDAEAAVRALCEVVERGFDE